jgi:hypothetical protein
MPKADIKRLFDHGLSERTEYCKLSKCYKLMDTTTNKQKKLKGITKILKQVFWKNYAYKKDKFSVSSGSGGLIEGKTRGSLVHRELRDFFNLDEKTFKAKHPKPHLFTKKAIVAMAMWDLTPMKAEFAICDPKLMIGTGIDAICIRNGEKFIILDWKCGFDGYFEKGNGFMSGILNKITNCPLHQGYIQLLIESEILKRNYGITVDEMAVIQITKDGISPKHVPNEMKSLASPAYDLIIKHLQNIKLEKQMQKSSKRKIRNIK